MGQRTSFVFRQQAPIFFILSISSAFAFKLFPGYCLRRVKSGSRHISRIAETQINWVRSSRLFSGGKLSTALFETLLRLEDFTQSEILIVPGCRNNFSAIRARLFIEVLMKPDLLLAIEKLQEHKNKEQQ